ncbi:MAG: nucleotide exchange factor GrpE [Actinobacteria bacterium RBG_16_64_13]|nr:MAG: nucleotide exchange factor GrpE [Actinobacteria bacterium RBG_16_64_13]
MSGAGSGGRPSGFAAAGARGGSSGESAAAAKAAQAEREALVAENEAVIAERDALVRERDEAADSLLRLRAEFDNFRRRASRELVEARERAQGELLSDLLPVLDNMERALDAAEHHEEGKVLEGVRLTRNMFVELLERAGVEEIAGIGAPFDPQIHDAMLVQPSDQPEGAVSAILARGYRQGDRVLRPARVAVSAGLDGAGGVAAAG